MAIKSSFKGNIDKTMRLFLEEVERQIIESLCRIGEEAVSLARLDHANNWQDQTGNLRSSIGYVVFKDGHPISQSAFEQVAAANASKSANLNGSAVGEALAKRIGADTDGYTLVVVAGMNYAVHVEAKGRDVLTSAEKHAEKRIAQELADLVTNIKDAFG